MLKSKEVYLGVLMGLVICIFFTVGFTQDDIREIKKQLVEQQKTKPKTITECKVIK